MIFSYYFYDFLIAGYILLLAMVGAIVLSLDKNKISKVIGVFSDYSKEVEME